MDSFTKEELQEARRAITSTLGKCEKVQLKLREGSPQFSQTRNRINAFRIAVALINRELGESEV